MTCEEALYWCEQFTDNIVLVDPQREKMVLALQAMKVCKEALKKQIPKKPIDKTLEYDGYYGYCPCCNHILSDYREYKRCYSCGQALDWSDTE